MGARGEAPAGAVFGGGRAGLELRLGLTPSSPNPCAEPGPDGRERKTARAGNISSDVVTMIRFVVLPTSWAIEFLLKVESI